MAGHKPFRFGAVAFSPPSSREEWASLARKVEDLGYSTLLVGDHVCNGLVGPIAALMAAADDTTSLRISSHVFANDFRHPVVLAQEAATLDLLSGGRLEFGIGSGWMRADYEMSGIAFDPPGVRVSRLEEAVPLIKRCFQDEPVTFSGTYYQVQDLNLLPKPVQRPHPPIFVGGGGKRVLSLAAREAHIVSLDPIGTAAGTKDFATITAEAVEQKIEWVRAAAGDRFDALELHIFVYMVNVTEDRQGAAEQVIQLFATVPPTMFSNTPTSVEEVLNSPHFLVGTVEQIAEELQARRERYGISYITVPDFMGNLDTLSSLVARLAGT